MIRDITIGQYLPGKSALHKMDPRVKIIVTFAFIIVIFMCKNFWSLGLMVLFTALCTILAGVPMRMMLKSLRPVMVILVFTGILNIFYTSGGNKLLEFWKITVTDKGIYTAVFMIVRIVCLIAGSSLLTYTTTPTMLTDAIERILSPLKVFKIQVHTLAMMMTLALRFIPTLIEEIERIMNAQKARGADLESGGFIKRAKALIPILIPLFISAFRRAYELAFAMECRCYRGGEGRTRMKQMKVKATDIVASAVTAALLGAVIFLNIYFKPVIG
ncbi:MAG: energy-coupling factor transporter transmembrane protein EcfT [Clostridiales bacterium]|nr:energy-coupling factor transporter transmembrane protein EcfT [Clostridiales bacterium]